MKVTSITKRRSKKRIHTSSTQIVRRVSTFFVSDHTELDYFTSTGQCRAAIKSFYSFWFLLSFTVTELNPKTVPCSSRSNLKMRENFSSPASEIFEREFDFGAELSPESSLRKLRKMRDSKEKILSEKRTRPCASSTKTSRFIVGNYSRFEETWRKSKVCDPTLFRSLKCFIFHFNLLHGHICLLHLTQPLESSMFDSKQDCPKSCVMIIFTVEVWTGNVLTSLIVESVSVKIFSFLKQNTELLL